MNNYDWIIGICYTEANGIKLLRFRGSIEEMKEKLLALINEDRHRDKNCWYDGCETVDDVSAEDNGLGYELYGYGTYDTYSIQYTAKALSHIETI